MYNFILLISHTKEMYMSFNKYIQFNLIPQYVSLCMCFHVAGCVGCEYTVCMHSCPGTFLATAGDGCHHWMPLWWCPQSQYLPTIPLKGIKLLFLVTQTQRKKKKMDRMGEKCLRSVHQASRMTVSDSWRWHGACHRVGTLARSLTPCLQSSPAEGVEPKQDTLCLTH